MTFIYRINRLLNKEIWKNDENMPWLKKNAFALARKIVVSCRFFFLRGHMDYATQLSFSTIIAIVPLVALFFAIGRGFGLSEYIEAQLRNALSSMPQVADQLFSLANSYLTHAQTGIIIGIGIIIMLYSILSLIHNIEYVFDTIWQVKDERSFGRLIIDYTAMLFLLPVAIILFSGMSIFVSGALNLLPDFKVLSYMTKILINVVAPWVVLTGIFTAANIFIPNTHVKFSNVIGPSMLASALMLLLQAFYVYGQIFLTSYNAIYGSLAAIPLFMLWMLISWYIILFCTELCYANQNENYYVFLLNTSDISHHDIIIISGIILSKICKTFREKNSGITAAELNNETHIPIRIVIDILNKLKVARFIDDKVDYGTEHVIWSPKTDTDKITLGLMMSRLDRLSAKKEARDMMKSVKIPQDTLNRINVLQKNYALEMDNILVRDLIDNEPEGKDE